jgi:phosphoribosylformylglycinamidine (FGAM) synthase-like enzyme
VALVESCISQQVARDTPRLIGAEIHLVPPGNGADSRSSLAALGGRIDALLFGETQGRIVISTSAQDAVKVVERARLLGVKAARIGTVDGDNLRIKTAAGEWAWSVAELYDLWWNSIARAMRE